jgi:hypothetical protein
MPWIAITINTLYEARVAALVDACDTAARKLGQPARSAGLIQGVVNEIRRKIASCPSNQVDSDTTKIPESLRDLAVDLILARMASAISQPLSEDEAKAVKYRQEELNRIAECKDVVEQPDLPVDPEVQSGPSVTLVRPIAGQSHPFGLLGSSS